MLIHPDTTQLLREVRLGSRTAFDDLYAHVYDDLRHAAHHRLARYRVGQTLNTTALVHEAYIRLVDQSQVHWQDRAHFLALASRAMRFILIDHVRSRTAQKRGGAEEALPLEAIQVAAEDRMEDLLALNEALDQLTAHDPRLGQLVEYRFFGGLTYEEIAEVVEMSVPTVKRDWVRARAWLFRAMQGSDEPPIPPAAIG